MRSARPAYRRLSIVTLILILGAGAILACYLALAGREFADELYASDGRWVAVGESFGQTLVARHGGLKSIAVELQSSDVDAAKPLTLTLHVRLSPSATTDVRVSSITLPARFASGPQLFRFEALPDSNGQAYYIFVDAPTGNGLQTLVVDGDRYNDGAFYVDHQAQDAQSAFRLSYDAQSIALDLLRWGLAAGAWSVLAVVVFVLPGFMLLSLADVALSDRVALAAGVTIGLYAVVTLWTHLIGLQVMSQFVWAMTVLSVGWLAVALIRAGRSREMWSSRLRGLRSADTLWPLSTWAVAFLIVLFTRLFVLRGLPLPMWGDSYHHTMIAQLISDHNGLFENWAPYAELQSLSYHFGFHVAVAAWHWITQMPMPESTLWTGQFVNVLAVLALCPLAARLGGGRWAWPVVIVVAGLLSPMPMYYVNWGRYTQLAGQLVLPAAVLLLWRVLDASRRDWRLWAITALTWGGLALTHYRVLIFGVCFVLAWLAIEGWRRHNWQGAARVVAIGIAGLLLCLPWLVNLYGGRLLGRFAIQLSTLPSATPAALIEYNSLGDVFFYLPAWGWLLLILSAGWMLRRSDRAATIVALWWFGVLVSANPQWLGLPGLGAVSNFAVFIAVYAPAGLLIGSAAGTVVERLSSTEPHGPVRLAKPLVFLCVLGLAALGGVARLGDLHKDASSLAFAPDIRAAEWIKGHTPPNAKFLVNSFFAYGGTVIVGSDGGWWLPLLSGRATTLPPINYADERGIQPDYKDRVNALATLWQREGTNSERALAALRDASVTHVYIGQRQGRTNYDGPNVIRPDVLQASPAYRAVYHQDRVWIFELQRP